MHFEFKKNDLKKQEYKQKIESLPDPPPKQLALNTLEEVQQAKEFYLKNVSDLIPSELYEAENRATRDADEETIRKMWNYSQ